METKSPFSNVIQIGVVVKDMEKAIERLTALGMGPFEHRLIPPDATETYRGEPFKPNERLKISVSNLGNTEIELIQPTEGGSPHKEFLDSMGEGVQHIACLVEDVDKEVDELIKKGVTVLLRSRRKNGGVAYLDLGVAGLIVELVQRKFKDLDEVKDA